MSTPKHQSGPGSSYFVTTKCWQGGSIFQVAEIADILLQTLFYYREQRAYLLHEFVLMPDHLHLLLTPSPTTTLEKAVQLIKGGSSHRIHKERNQKMQIWQEGFYDWTIRDAHDWQTKVEYIRLNPVRAKLVVKPEDWPYSSASRKFDLDPIPPKYMQTSGAKAPLVPALTPGLKPRPPKEETVPGRASAVRMHHATSRVMLGLKPPLSEPLNVGAEGPTPKPVESPNLQKSLTASRAQAHSSHAVAPGLKLRPSKEQNV